MNKIVPFLIYDKQAVEAAEFYCQAIPNSMVKGVIEIENTPSGTIQMVDFSLAGNTMHALNAGPYFKFTPAISLMVICPTAVEVDEIWSKLSDGAEVLMELGSYPFSERYGWLQDKFGLSWQIIYAPMPLTHPMVTPVMMFTGEVYGKAKEAIEKYRSLFPNSQINEIVTYQKGEEPDTEGAIKYASFSLFGQQFAAMESAYDHGFGFTEAFSFAVLCSDQAELDSYWDCLSAHPDAEQCGWLKDQFGVWWQLWPENLPNLMFTPDREARNRGMQAVTTMKKLIIADVIAAYEGR